MKVRLCIYNAFIAIIFSLAAVTPSVAQQSTFKYGVEYKCGEERVVVFYCRNDSGQQVSASDNYCHVEYPDRPRRMVEIPVFASVLQSEIAAHLKTCTDPKGSPAGPSSNSKVLPEANLRAKAQAKIDQAYTFFQAKDYVKAIEANKAASAIDPTWFQPYVRIAICYSHLNQWPETLAAGKQAVALAPRNEAALLSIAKAQNELKLYAEALETSRQLIKITPNLSVAHQMSGIIYLNQKQYEQASASFSEAIRLKPDDALSHHMLGSVYYNLKNYSKAIESYEQAIRLKYDYAAVSHASIGDAYLYGLNQYDKAVTSYREAIRLRPGYDYASKALGLAYLSLKQYPEALAAFLEAERLKPDIAEYLYNSGHTYVLMGKKSDALRLYRRLIRNKTWAPKLFDEIKAMR